jgi:hypothetical protein
MTKTEIELINLIRNSDNPNALAIAIEIIADFLTTQPLSSQEQEIVALVEHA